MTLRQIAQVYPQARVTVAANDIANYTTIRDEQVVSSFYPWAIQPDAAGNAQLLRWVTPIYAVILVLLAAIYRLTHVRLHPWRDPQRRRTLDAYYEADVVMACGGGYLFASAGAGSWFLILWLIAAFGCMLGKPTVLLPQSIGPLGAAWQCRLVRWLVNRSVLTLVREQTSYDFLRGIGADEKRIRIHPDIAFDFDGEAPHAPRPTPHTPRIGLTLLNWVAQGNQGFGQNDYEAAAIALINHIGAQGGKVYLFAQVRGPFFADDDRVVAERILAQVNPAYVEWCESAISSEALIARYAEMDAFVATRLHSAIFAMNRGVPTLVVGYLHKSMGVLRALDMLQWCIQIDQVNTSNLIERFDALIQQRADVLAHMQRILPKTQQRCGQYLATGAGGTGASMSKPRLRVVQFALGMPHEARLGGAEVFAASLAQALDPAEFEVALCGLWRMDSATERAQIEALQARGITCVTLMPYQQDLRTISQAIGPLRRWLKTWRADIVNTHAEYADLVSMAAWLTTARLSGAQAFVPIRTVHLLPEFDIVSRYRPLIAKILRVVYPRFSRQDIGVSQQIVDALNQKRTPHNAAKLIYNAIDPEAIRAKVTEADCRNALGIASDAPLFGSVGRLEPQKGYDHFLNAAAQVGQTLPHARFIVVGSGVLEDALKAQAQQLGLGTAVIFVGTRPDVPDLMRGMDVFVSSSLWEGLPTVLMEALALGIPTVATDIPGSRELIVHEQTGLLAASANPNALAEAMLRQYQIRDQAKQMAANGLQHIEQFSIQAVAQQYARLYQVHR